MVCEDTPFGIILLHKRIAICENRLKSMTLNIYHMMNLLKYKLFRTYNNNICSMNTVVCIIYVFFTAKKKNLTCVLPPIKYPTPLKNKKKNANFQCQNFTKHKYSICNHKQYCIQFQINEQYTQKTT